MRVRDRPWEALCCTALLFLPARAAPAALPRPPTPQECLAASGGRCLTPATLRALYGLGPLGGPGPTGRGVTVGVVVSFGSPTLRHDLAVYDQQYGLPALSLQTVAPAGEPPAFDPTDPDRLGWAGETTLDVEMVHVIAPDAKILVITTPVSETEGLQGFPEIIRSENAVLGRVDVLSQSFAATEPTFDSAQQIRRLSEQIYPQAKAAGVTVVSATGDNGPVDAMRDGHTLFARAVTDWPASDPLVTAVGGTTVHVGADGQRISPDAAWGGRPGAGAGGGGVSEVFARPRFQDGVKATVGAHRGVPDVALDAAVAGGLITYGSYSPVGWSVGGGTSQATPLFAGLVALADGQAGARLGYLNDALYRLGAAGGIRDVTAGSNALVDAGGQRNPVPGYPARPGYDLATGLGSIDATRFVPAIIAARRGQLAPLAAAGAAAGTGPAPAGSAPAGSASPGATSGPRAAPPPQPGRAPRGPSAGASRELLPVGAVAAAAVLLGAALAALGVTVRRRRRSRPMR
ncbi:MAG TPA: S53 family peptidase [Mycobacteriales bacterium]|nr:S53 family peptidase [Mycobacteriales bacterium]